jgi:hypothetical protein
MPRVLFFLVIATMLCAIGSTKSVTAMASRNFGPDQTPLGETLAAMNLIEMRTPRQSWPIGTILTVTRNARGQIVKVDDVCNPALLAPQLEQQGVTYMISQTSEMQSLEQRSMSGGISVSAPILQQIAADARISGAQSFRMNVMLNNTKLLYTDASSLRATVRRLMEVPDCRDSVRQARQEGKELTALYQVLVADLSYSVSFTGDVDASARANAMSQISAALNGRVEGGGNRIIAGNGLTFGFALAPFSPMPQ